MTRTFIIAAIMLFLISVVSVSAANVTVSDISLSRDDDVERSNPQLEGSENRLDDNEELEFVTFNIPVTVIGSATIENVVPNLNTFSYRPFDDEVVEDLLPGEDVRFNVSPSLPLDVTDSSVSFSVRILVPSNLDSVDDSFNRVRHSVKVDFSIDDAGVKSTETSTVSFFAENGLELQSVELDTDDETIDCDVEEDDQDLDCDDEADELTPGEDFDLLFEIENTFDDDSDLDIDDVDVDIDSDNSDVDPDDESFDEDIDAGDQVDITITMEVDEDVDDNDDAEIEIQALGEDVNGAQHGFRHTFDIEFDVEDYDIDLDRVVLSPAAVCAGDVSTISFEVENLGSKKQTNVRVLIQNDQLGISQIFDRISLEEEDESDNDFSDEFTFNVRQNTRPGTYPISITVFFEDKDDDDAFVRESHNLVVQDCTGEFDDDQDDRNDRDDDNDNTDRGDNIIVVQPGATTQQPQQPSQPTPTAPAVTTATPRGGSDTGFVVGMVVAIIVLVVIIAAVIAYLLRKKK